MTESDAVLGIKNTTTLYYILPFSCFCNSALLEEKYCICMLASTKKERLYCVLNEPTFVPCLISPIYSTFFSLSFSAKKLDVFHSVYKIISEKKLQICT